VGGSNWRNCQDADRKRQHSSPVGGSIEVKSKKHEVLTHIAAKTTKKQKNRLITLRVINKRILGNF